MNYPDNIKTVRARMVYWFYMQWFIFEKGKGEFVGRFFSLYTEFGVTLLVLDRFGFHPKWWKYAIAIVALAIFFYIVGRVYMRYNIDKINVQISNERNQFLCDIHREVVKKGGEF